MPVPSLHSSRHFSPVPYTPFHPPTSTPPHTFSIQGNLIGSYKPSSDTTFSGNVFFLPMVRRLWEPCASYYCSCIIIIQLRAESGRKCHIGLFQMFVKKNKTSQSSGSSPENERKSLSQKKNRYESIHYV